MGDDIEYTLKAAAAQLGAVHCAAQGLPVPFHATTEDDIQRQRNQDMELLKAWISGETRVVHCSTASRRRRAGKDTFKIATLHGDRVLVSLADRPPRFGDDQRRPRLYLLTDLDLLEAEGHRGVTINCRECHGPHRLRSEWLRGSGRARVSKPSGPSDDHPWVQEAAFAEVVGGPRPGPTALDDLIIGLTPGRERAFRERYADQPAILAWADTWSTRRWIIPQTGHQPAKVTGPDHPLFDQGARLAEWPPPESPE